MPNMDNNFQCSPGMRYKRRGVDEAGHCANYVETEQVRLTGRIN